MVLTLVYNKTKFKERRHQLRRNQTEAEKLLWKHLRNKRFWGLKFFRQYSVGSYILDFYCSTHKLAIELDGGLHAEEKNQKYDKVRTDYLESLGIEVMRFWNSDVIYNIEGVLAKIEQQTNPSLPPL